MAKRVMRVWHDIVTYKSFDIQTGLYRCFHCKRLFPQNETCGDHFPHTKGSRPDLKFDTENGVCSCMRCNVSNSPTRRASLAAHE